VVLGPFFEPCWDCQHKGWVVVSAVGWRRRVLKALGMLRNN